MRLTILIVVLLAGCDAKYDYDSGVCRSYRSDIKALEQCLVDDRCFMNGADMRRLESSKLFIERNCKEPNER